MLDTPAALIYPRPIRRAAVIGAGTMGAAIAAHLVNAGVPTLLLDIPGPGSDPADRNAPVRAGLERARKARPPAFMDADPAAQETLLTLGNTDDDLPRLADADWIVEAIIEKPEAKRALWERVHAAAGPHTIFCSNSSGIPMRVQSHGRPADFKRRFLGAHFYNPPRWLYLLELIPTADTAPEVLETVRAFGDRVLGKGIVIAHDVPGFIGNRVGVYALLQAARTMEAMGLTPETVDALTGPILGHPKSATLRTLDAVGLDVLAFISEDLTRALDGREDFALPTSLRALLDRGDRGEKTGRGYYQRVKNPADGSSTILSLNLQTMAYEDRRADLPELKDILRLKTPAERTRALLALPGPAGEFTRRTVYEMLRFAADRYPEVAGSITEIDNALKWGFGWELGPFELIDALGHEQVAGWIEDTGAIVPPLLAEHRANGQPFHPPAPAHPEPDPAGLLILRDLRRDPARTLAANGAAALVDLGDGVLGLEFTSKANAVNADVYALVEQAKDLVAARGMLGLVIGNQGRWFSAGADLGALLADCRAGDRAKVSAMIAGFQRMTTGLRAAPFPVVCAPFGMTLGGGCETMLYADFVQADAELTTGLVEHNVGLMPSAGGTTEMLARFLAQETDPFRAAERAWDLITSRRVTASAHEARRLGYLRETDAISLNKRRVLGDAREALLALAANEARYLPPPPRTLHATGAAGYARLTERSRQLQSAGAMTAYDAHLADQLARILTGGGPDQPTTGPLPEERFLELEREVFIDLCFRPETQARIEHTLKTGKPLRN